MPFLLSLPCALPSIARYVISKCETYQASLLIAIVFFLLLFIFTFEVEESLP